MSATKCTATTKTGAACRNNAIHGGMFCRIHSASATEETAPIVASASATETAPAPTTEETSAMDTTTEETAPIVDAPAAPAAEETDPTMTAPIVALLNGAPLAPAAEETDSADRDAKRRAAEFYARRQQKRGMVADSNRLNGAQKTTARAIVDMETESRQHTTMGAHENDNAIMAFDILLAKNDDTARALKPRHYDTKPAWLGEKDWKKARRAFNTAYARTGASAFDRDVDGRLVMPLPLTPARYMGMVISGDVLSVLHYSGAWKESDDGTFLALANMDGVAPIVADVYRTGAAHNRAIVQLDKARATLRATEETDSKYDARVKRVNNLLTLVTDTRGAFIRAYVRAVHNSADLVADAARAVQSLHDVMDASASATETAPAAEETYTA